MPRATPCSGRPTGRPTTRLSPSTSYTIRNLTPGTPYTVRVTAHNDTGDSPPSDAVTATPLAQSPSQVTGVEVVTEVAYQLAVSWEAAERADAYKVQWKAGDEAYAAARTAEVTATSYAIDNLTAGIPHTVRVVATRQYALDGLPSDEVLATPLASPDQVTGVRLVKVVAGLNYRLSVSWEAAEHSDAYKVQWKAGDEQYAAERTVEVTATRYTIENLKIGTAYTVRVIGTSEAVGDGQPSNEVTASGQVTIAKTPPAQVTGVVVTAEVGQLAVRWSAATRADAYRVQWKAGDQTFDVAEAEGRQAEVTATR